MTLILPARLCTLLQQGLSLTALTLLLAGCNLEPHDSLDTTTPANMPVPEGAKPVAKAPTRPVSPPPTDADLGMPVYPNATLYVDPMGQPVSPSMTTGESRQAMLTTPDSIDKVIAFYKSKLTETDANGSSKPVTPMEQPENGKRSVVLTGNDAGGNILMAIVHEESGKTVLELMHTPTATMPTSLSGSAGSVGKTPAANLPDQPATSRPDPTTPSTSGVRTSPGKNP